MERALRFESFDLCADEVQDKYVTGWGEFDQRWDKAGLATLGVDIDKSAHPDKITIEPADRETNSTEWHRALLASARTLEALWYHVYAWRPAVTCAFSLRSAGTLSRSVFVL